LQKLKWRKYLHFHLGETPKR